MNDPHVVALIYRVEHGDGVTWNHAEPLVDPETPEEFRLQVKDKKARFELKVHYAKESEARKAIENFIGICIPVSAFSAKGDTRRVIRSWDEVAAARRGLMRLTPYL